MGSLHALAKDFGGAAAIVCERVAPQIDNSEIVPGALSQFEPSRLRLLTAREREVLDRLMDGCSNKIIAYRMDLSATTVKAHVANILKKLGVHRRLRAVAIIRSQA
jgi:DNA-binding NarL/FixJ family response regulator